MQFSGKFGVFTPPLEGSRPPLGKILDPPLIAYIPKPSWTKTCGFNLSQTMTDKIPLNLGSFSNFPTTFPSFFIFLRLLSFVSVTIPNLYRHNISILFLNYSVQMITDLVCETNINTNHNAHSQHIRILIGKVLCLQASGQYSPSTHFRTFDFCNLMVLIHLVLTTPTLFTTWIFLHTRINKLWAMVSMPDLFGPYSFEWIPRFYKRVLWVIKSRWI